MSHPKCILCRCEDVTLEDFREAFQEGFSEFESLKRYTGVGTGFCQGKGPLYHIFKLSDVSRPRIVTENVHNLWGDSGGFFYLLRGAFFEEVMRQQFDILLPFPEGRHVNFHDVKTPVKILPELPSLDQLFQIFVGGGDDAQIHLNLLVGTKFFKCFFL